MEKASKTLVDRLIRWRKDPLEFIYDMWGLKPQPLLPEYSHFAEHPAKVMGPQGEEEDFFKTEMFDVFIKGKHITWQQWLLFRAIKWGIQGKASPRIAVESGHGTGKSASLSMIVIWYLISFEEAQVPCTAPTAYQMNDVLWKEIKIWMDRMPTEWSNLLDWQSNYLRVKESPETWFARARTARKENPEALAGVHADNVLFVIDEASAIANEIFNSAEGSLTGPNVLVIMISNHTRIIGYFHDAFNADRASWQTLSFDGEESPIVDHNFVARIANKHGRDSDEFRIRVSGKPPREDAADDTGYVILIEQKDITLVPPGARFTGVIRLGVDPAGQGKDETVWTIRDNFRAQVVAREKISDGKGIARKTIEIQDYYGIKDTETDLDSFGVGADALFQLGLAGKAVNGWNVGELAELKDQFINMRAQAYWSMRTWLKQGGELVEGGEWKEQAIGIRYRRSLSGKIQVMPKEVMKKKGFKSPNDMDALMLTFIRPESNPEEDEWGEKEERGWDKEEREYMRESEIGI